MNKRLLFATLVMVMCLLGVAVILSTGQPSARAGFQSTANEPQWGTDFQVNPIVSSTPSGQRNVYLAVNPINLNQVLAGYHSIGLGVSPSAFASSTDAGLTWSNGQFNDPWPWGEDSLLPLGSAGVGFDAAGTAYYSSLAIGSNNQGYFVLTSTTGTVWSAPVPVVVSDYSESRNQAGMAVDSRGDSPYANSVYMFWLYTNYVSPFFQGVWMRYSRDGGLTWSADVQVSDPGHEYSFFPLAAVASDGSIYVTFQQLANNYVANPPKLYLDRSTDGGQTWGTDRLISGAQIVPIGRPDFKDRELTLIGGSNCVMIHINHYPHLGVSPTDPNKVYVVWNDGRWEPQANLCGYVARHSDVAFSRSTDAGQTWTAPVRLNNDPIGNGIDQWQPTIAVRSDGLIGATWLDRRYDPGGYLYDLVYTQSTDEGLTWGSNQRVSDFSSNPNSMPDYKGLDDLGYRNALVFGPNYVLPGWLDTRQGVFQGDFFTDRGMMVAAGPTVTPARTPTPTPTRTPTRTPTPTPTVPAMLAGHVTWQGRPAQPNTLQQLPITLTLKLGTTEVNYPSTPTDTGGFFTVSVGSLPGGIYNWRVKGPKYLANSGTVECGMRNAECGIGNSAFVEMGLMKAGDANDDNRITVGDFNILKNTFGKSVGDPGYDDRADFTGDVVVNTSDFNLLKVNFGVSGECISGMGRVVDEAPTLLETPAEDSCSYR